MHPQRRTALICPIESSNSSRVSMQQKMKLPQRERRHCGMKGFEKVFWSGKAMIGSWAQDFVVIICSIEHNNVRGMSKLSSASSELHPHIGVTTKTGKDQSNTARITTVYETIEMASQTQNISFWLSVWSPWQTVKYLLVQTQAFISLCLCVSVFDVVEYFYCVLLSLFPAVKSLFQCAGEVKWIRCNSYEHGDCIYETCFKASGCTIYSSPHVHINVMLFSWGPNLSGKTFNENPMSSLCRTCRQKNWQKQT